MGRYIDVEKIKITADTMLVDGECYVPLLAVKQAIARTPTEDVEEIRHGRWELIGKNVRKCTACGFARNIKTQFGWSFCPNCGCKLDNSGDV